MILPKFNNYEDLITSKEATTQGFIAQAREKIELATPYIESAIKFQKKLATISNIKKCLGDKSLRTMLLAVVGLSDKAITHLQPDQEITILNETLKNIQKKAGENWSEELVLRYLLTKGDALGGSSRNLTGTNAKAVFANAITNALTKNTIKFSLEMTGKVPRVRKISWKKRMMVFDKKSNIVEKNIDVIVLDNSSNDDENTLLEKKSNFIACGEVKGGIDPAGADEHWKTANSALERVRHSFGIQRPALFFVGAAIVSSMAKEIMAELRDNRLTYAANLTKPEQLESLANWLISL